MLSMLLVLGLGLGAPLVASMALPTLVIAEPPLAPQDIPKDSLVRTITAELGSIGDWRRRLRHKPELVADMLALYRLDTSDRTGYPEFGEEALESLAALGPRAPQDALKEIVEAGTQFSYLAFLGLALTGDAALVPWLSEQLDGPEAGAAFRALGMLGVPEALPPMQAWLAQPERWRREPRSWVLQGAAYGADLAFAPIIEATFKDAPNSDRREMNRVLEQIKAANTPDPTTSLLPWLTTDPATAAMGDDPTWALHVIRSRQWTQFIPLLRQLLTTRVAWLREQGVVDPYNPGNPMIMDGHWIRVGIRMPFAFDLAWTLYELGGELQPDELAVLVAEGFVEPEAD